MTNDLVPVQKTGVIEWTLDQTQLIKDTICKGATDDEFKLFLYTCTRTGLDPLARQIYAVKRWSNELQRKVMTVQTGIDGYRVIAERSGSYAGQDEAVWKFDDQNNLVSATATVYRFMQGQRVGFTATAFWDEYVQTDKDGKLNQFWKKMPRGQLAKCAEALAFRKAFPNDLSGLYTTEEMQQADNGSAPKEPVDDERAKLLRRIYVGEATLVNDKTLTQEEIIGLRESHLVATDSGEFMDDPEKATMESLVAYFGEIGTRFKSAKKEKAASKPESKAENTEMFEGKV